MKKIFLASQSPRRKDLLSRLGVDFTVIPANIDEQIPLETSPHKLVQEIAFRKACYVSNLLKDGLVIAADTIVVGGGQILGKPVDNEDAFRKLSLLSGKSHQVITGLCVFNVANHNMQIQTEVTTVFFRNITEDEIKAYIKTGESADKAGAYAIQGLGALFVDRIEGCYYNVVGLPLTRLYLMLKKEGVSLLRG